jgi:hypothetical protein
LKCLLNRLSNFAYELVFLKVDKLGVSKRVF